MEKLQERVAVVIAHVPRDLRDRLRERAQWADRSMSAEARLAIREHVARAEQPDREEPRR